MRPPHTAAGPTARSARPGGTVETAATGPLAAALAGAGHLDDALEPAARDELGQASAVFGIGRAAASALTPKQRKALVAAYRRAPKGGRDRNSQLLYQHEFGRLWLALGDVDAALAVAAKMRDCRYSGYGPAYLARDISGWLRDHPDEATPDRLRALPDVLAGPDVHPTDVADLPSAQR